MSEKMGKKTPKEEMDNRCIFMTLHMTLSAVPYLKIYVFMDKIVYILIKLWEGIFSLNSFCLCFQFMGE